METIHSEKEFEYHFRNDILIPLIGSNRDFDLFYFKKAVDVIARKGENSELFFIEVKYHKINHRRLDFGAGFQSEVLRNRTRDIV